jgi:hypothetical protein
MHLRPLGVITCLALGLPPSAGCKATPAAPSSAASPVAPESTAQRSAVEGPCGNRPSCVVHSSESIEGLPHARLVKAVIAAPGSDRDEDKCERREYWLTNGAQRTLLAADCAAQYGADSQGPAEVKLAGSNLTVRYVEFQEDDRCELVDATINLAAVTVERQDRRAGSVAQDRCVPGKPHNALPPAGDGSISKPLLVLHRG